SWLNDKATSETRGRVFALYTAVAWAMSGVGPLGLNLKDPNGTILFALITVVMVSAIIPLALTTVGNPEIGHRTHFGIRRLYKISPVGVLACFSSGIVNTAIFGLLPVYCNKLGYSNAQISIILSVSVLAGFVIQFPIGWLADSLGRRPLMLGTTIVALALSVWIVNLPDDRFLWLVGLTFALTGMISPLYGLGVGQTNDYIERKDFVGASAGLLFAWGIGASIGPAVAAPAMTQFGPHGLFYFVTAYHGALATFILYRMLVRRALRAKEQGNFVAVPVTQATYGAPELDPRCEPQVAPATASKVISETVD
ncbi:MAG: MFS transporter, partial [Dongiaceae bacterium]